MITYLDFLAMGELAKENYLYQHGESEIDYLRAEYVYSDSPEELEAAHSLLSNQSGEDLRFTKTMIWRDLGEKINA